MPHWLRVFLEASTLGTVPLTSHETLSLWQVWKLTRGDLPVAAALQLSEVAIILSPILQMGKLRPQMDSYSHMKKTIKLRLEQSHL